MMKHSERTPSYIFAEQIWVVALGLLIFASIANGMGDGQAGLPAETKETWSINYDNKTPIRTAEWDDYLQLPFNPNVSGLFSDLDPSVVAYDYGLYNPNLGGGHIARAAQHPLTYGNFLAGRKCLEQAIANYLTANNVAEDIDRPDRFLYKQGLWPMRKSGIVPTDSLIDRVSKSLMGLHGGDLVYSKIRSNGPENGAEVVTLNCTVCHESKALVPMGNGTFKAVRQPWGSEGYVTKNTHLMSQALQDAVALAASGHACAQAVPDQHIYAALYQIQGMKHQSTNPDGSSAYVDLDPRRLVALTPESSFYNPTGQVAHTVLNLLVTKHSWTNGRPSSIDQAYQLYRPEDVLFNNQFFPILNANYNQLYGTKRDGTPAPVNFSMNSAWSQKYYTPTDNMFHGMGCSYKSIDASTGQETYVSGNCSIVEKSIALAAATNSQGLNPDLTSDTLSRFPAVSPGYKWPLRRYAGPDGVFERTNELFIGIQSNAGNPQIDEIVNQRGITYGSIYRGQQLYNTRCASCHGTSSFDSGSSLGTQLNPGKTDVYTTVDTLNDVPTRAYIANLRSQPYVPQDAPRGLVIKDYDGYRGSFYYGDVPAPKKIAIKNLVGVAFEQRFGCYLSLYDFLQRNTPSPVQVTTSKLDVMKLGFQKLAQYDHTPANESLVLASYPAHNIYWQKEFTECGPLGTGGVSQPSQFYDAPFHGKMLDGVTPQADGTVLPKLTETQTKEMIDFFVAISFNKMSVPNDGIGGRAADEDPTGLYNFRLMLSGNGGDISYGVDGSCDNKCAKFGETCDWNIESNYLATNKKCCGEFSAPNAYGGLMKLECGKVYGASGPDTWGYCTYDDHCWISPSNDNGYRCIGRKCVLPSPSPLPSSAPSCGQGGSYCSSNMECCSGNCDQSDEICIGNGTVLSSSPSPSPSQSPTPIVGSISPTSGILGSSITVTGSNLSGATLVKINGTSVSFTPVSATELTANVDSGVTSGAISVTTPYGTATGAQNFMVYATISGFSPTSGGAGTVVAINGTGFSEVTQVKFNNVPASFSIVSSTQINATVPGTASSGIITVTSAGGVVQSSGSFLMNPSISGFSPTAGGVGSQVVISGSNFNEASSVTINGTAANFIVNNNGQITATIPLGATSGLITVNCISGSATSALSYTVVPPPTTTFANTTAVPGMTITLNGANFVNVTSVKFNITNAASFNVVSASQITAVIAAGTSTGKVTIVAAGGQVVSTGTLSIAGAPTITSFTPASAGSGQAVTINGTNFYGSIPASNVKFNGVAASAVTVNSNIKITATVPTGASTGKISVTTSVGTGLSATDMTFIPTPVVSSFTPTMGPANGTQTVVITGSNFTGATSVKFNATTIVPPAFTVNSNTQITATVPAGATTGKISVLNGTVTGISSGNFTVYAAPTVGTIPASAAKGVAVTIPGTNFYGTPIVRFNGTQAQKINSMTATSIVAVVPEGATTGPVTVQTNSGTGTSAASMTITTPAAPTVTSFSVNSGAVGLTISVNGTNFYGTNPVVKFNDDANTGVAATSVTFVSNVKLDVVVPAGAATGKVSVTTASGRGLSTGNFTVTVPQTCTGLTPASGPIGTSVTVTGTNFVSGTVVQFYNGSTWINATSTNIISPTSMTATVPTGAMTGLVKVNLSGQITNCSTFTVTQLACFIAGTKINTVTGKKNIEDIKIRDQVYSYNEADGTFVVGKVIRQWVTADIEYGFLKLSDGSKIGVSAEHPFYLAKEKKFVPAKELKKGDVLLKMENPLLASTKVVKAGSATVMVTAPVKFDKKADVYNFTVDGYHNYFVDGILVHNK